MSSEYYSLEKAAEVLALPTAEVNRLREKNQLRAFRDGSSWKFRKADVDNYLAESIKSRSSNQAAGESDFDLLSLDDDSEETPTLLADASFESLMDDDLSLDKMVDAKPAEPESIGTYDLQLSDDDLGLGGDDLVLEDDSPVPAPAGGRSDIDLAIDNDDLVLDEHGSSRQLNLAGDSGISLLDAGDEVELQPADGGGSDVMLELDDDDDILSLVDEDLAVDHTSTISIPVEDDFQLTPDSGMNISDDSESASQVIALEEDNMFGAPGESSPFAAAAESPFDTGQTAPIGGGPVFGDPSAAAFGAPTGDFVSTGPTFATTPTSTEPEYKVGSVVFILIALVFMFLPCIMMLDLIRNIWSWNEPFVINSSIMELFKGFWPGLG